MTQLVFLAEDDGGRLPRAGREFGNPGLAGREGRLRRMAHLAG
jgi:hypothetical protein